MTKQEQILNDSRYVPVYDHGFVGLIDTMGDDHEICEAARVSYGTGTKTVNDDRNLIRYLMRQWHTSPFEMAELKFHMKMPMFVFRHVVRHRTANVNEYSGRYSILSNEFYVPSPDYMAPQSTSNKQGRAGEINDEAKKIVHDLMQSAADEANNVYRALLDNNGAEDLTNIFGDSEYPGLARELARTVLPVSVYTEFYWKIDLHNFLHFARLRLDHHSQQETRDFATTMYNLVKPHFPLSAEAFEDYRLFAKTLSRMDLLAVMDMLKGTFVPDHNHYGMSKREYTEFVDLFKPSVEHSRNVPTA